MKVLEADAKDRAKRRHEREKIANGLKEKGNTEFKQGNYEQALDFYTQVNVTCSFDSKTHSLILHFETVPNSKKLQTTTEMWLLKDFKIQIA